MLQLRDALPQLGVFRFEFGNPLVMPVIHDPRSLTEIAEMAKSICLTVTTVFPSSTSCNLRVQPLG
jgi:hypothetical protein